MNKTLKDLCKYNKNAKNKKNKKTKQNNFGRGTKMWWIRIQYPSTNQKPEKRTNQKAGYK
jgi:phage host-nuclease inhibitor protein Gam